MEKISEPIDMQRMAERTDEFERFDETVRRVVSISRDELRQRKERWSLDRAEKRRVRTDVSHMSFTDKH